MSREAFEASCHFGNTLSLAVADLQQRVRAYQLYRVKEAAPSSDYTLTRLRPTKRAPPAPGDYLLMENLLRVFFKAN